MILKIMKNDAETSNYNLRTISDVKDAIQIRDEKNERLIINFKDGSTEQIITSEKTIGNSYQDLYTWIYLMNENGKTIEKII